MSEARERAAIQFTRFLIRLPADEQEALLDLLGNPIMQEPERKFLGPILESDALLAVVLGGHRPGNPNPRALPWLKE